MDVELVAIGKTGMSFINSGMEEYIKRLKRYIPFKFVVLPDIKKGCNYSEIQQKEVEGDNILNHIQPSDYVILLDERGREFTSSGFAEYMEKQMVSGRRRLLFIIGGPYGFSDRVYNRADGKVSLSRMTFNHEMVRLFFVEQLYRAMTILRGEPYHHE